ncbi:endonuclease/exonuclease/phosphatase family protein [Rubinisphaera italica]|uniref:Endonuclease/Exonuclease/phosphatase family protein n=1 Tax=Rubinisphaera italica TaxID=2527969 RepID=A0A5C5XI36_9PLAN|nr:endonuclease/exonuclease/phosphatase family protein [Rubinisphaera italica]TWT62379.1 Endonuclease/Exonuclease/phosphatase family protein [Rubinisphaera italica]
MAKKKSQASWWIAVGILIVGMFSFLGKLQLGNVLPSIPTVSTGSTSGENPSGPTSQPPAASKDSIRIATFNIQVFGVSKMGKPIVRERLAELVRQFDLVAIQEIRSIDQSVLPNFVDLVNAQGADFKYLIGDRLGRTSSKEQYAYVYRSSLIEPVQGSIYNIEDRLDRLHREPFVGSFRMRSKPGEGGEPFSFTLVNMHTDPDEAEYEVGQLAGVYNFVTTYRPEEDDVIILGDLNVNASKLTPLTNIPLLRSVAGTGPTNTRGTKQYDHIVVNHQSTLEFTGRAGVLDMASFLKISPQEALDLSDHQPVWAEFRTTEQRGSIQVASPFTEQTVR